MANPRENKPVIHTKKHLARLERERRQTRIILYSFFGILSAIVGLLIYGYLDLNYLQARRPIAKVGDVNLSIGAWQARVRLQRNQLINQTLQYQQYSQVFGMDFSSQIQQLTTQLNSPASLGQSVLDNMINEELIRQETTKRGLSASPEEVDKFIHAAYNNFPDGTPTQTITPTPVTFPTLSPDTLALVTITPTPTQPMTETPTASAAPSRTSTPNPLESPTATLLPTATATLEATPTAGPTSTPLPTSTPYTLQGFQDQYQQSVTQVAQWDVTDTQFRQLYENQVLRQKLMDVITADVPHTQEQVWARHILVADEVTAQAVRLRLVNGEDFAKVAAQVSTDTGTKDKGGDLGWFGKGVMVPEFEQAAFSLKVGEISQPIQSQFGYHIIQVLAHEDVPLDASGYDQAKQTAFNDWLKSARDQYHVVTYDNWQNIVPTEPAVPTQLAQ